MLRCCRIALLFAVAAGLTPAAARADETPPVAPSKPDDLSAGHRDLDATTIQPAPPGQEWWRAVLTRFPTCASLTDGCQSCAREGDRLSCSTPAIACLRGEWRCTSATEDKPPDQPGDSPPPRDGAQPTPQPPKP